jgi:hypothetical protein
MTLELQEEAEANVPIGVHKICRTCAKRKSARPGALSEA